jgi:hypothetical protein
MKFVKLPDHEEITLREAVTAFVYGEARDASSGPLYPSLASDALLQELDSAARTGRIRFRALRIGDNKYQVIDPAYFNSRHELDWRKDEIQSWGPVDEQTGLEGNVFGVEWYDVHIDRQQFGSLLKNMGVDVGGNCDPKTPEPDVHENGPTYKTGAAGRPTSMHFALRIARRRLEDGDYPETKTAFAEQIAAELKATYPEAAPAKPKTIRQNPDFTELWRCRLPKKIDAN